MKYEPRFAASISGRIDRFCMELIQSLRISEGPVFFRVAGCWKKKYFGFNFRGTSS